MAINNGCQESKISDDTDYETITPVRNAFKTKKNLFMALWLAYG